MKTFNTTVKFIGKFMKLNKFLILSVLISAVILLCSFFPLKNESAAKITFPLGNVFVIKKGQRQMLKGAFNMKLYLGDKVKTQRESRCEIKFEDESIVRIAEQSIYTIEQANFKTKNKEVVSKLSIGKLWANIKKLAKSSDKWQLRGPAAVVGVRGTVYRMDADADSTTKVFVYEGEVSVNPSAKRAGGMKKSVKPGAPKQIQAPVEVQGPKEVSMEEWFEIIKAQQQIVIKPDGSYKKSEFNLAEDAKIDWVKWNKERDLLLEGR